MGKLDGREMNLRPRVLFCLVRRVSVSAYCTSNRCVQHSVANGCMNISNK